MMERRIITTSDKTEISIFNDDIMIFENGAFGGCSIPIELWPEYKKSIETLLSKQTTKPRPKPIHKPRRRR